MAKRSKKKTISASDKRHVAHSSKVSHGTIIDRWKAWSVLRAMLIIVTGCWIFWPALHGQWIGDDRIYITNNMLLHDPARLWKAWFQPGSFVEYYPIHESLQWMQWQMWGKDTTYYHLTNIVLHVISALLLWRLFGKLGLKHGWLGGLIFVAHPMAVDSVVLINEFKTSLSMPFFLLAILSWIDYEEDKEIRHYLIALTLFLVAMLCKITMMTFPLVILLYAWWKRGKISWSDVVASGPFFIISLVLGLTSIYAGEVYNNAQTQSVADPLAGQPLARFVLVGQTFLFYFSRVLFPITPMPIYPKWICNPASPVHYVPWLVLIGALALLYARRAGWERHALLGLGFFLIMLLPFCGVHWISYMKSTWVLEHLLYIPMIGLIGLAVAAFDQIYQQLSLTIRKAAVAVVVVIATLLAWQSNNYAAKFVNEETICRYTIRHNPNAWQAYINLGLSLLNEGRLSEATDAFKKCLDLDPNNADALSSYGNVLEMAGNLPGAVEHFHRALQIRPKSAALHCNLGNALNLQGDYPQALDEFVESLKIEPNNAATHFDYGLCLSAAGRDADAIVEYQRALSINPDLPRVHKALGSSLAVLQRKSEAIEQFEDALNQDPNDESARACLQSLQGPATGQ